MARCGCSSACSCSITAGANITVTGVGTAANPYVISSDATGALQVTDTPTVDLTLLGSGTVGDPHILSAVVQISATAGNVLTAQADGLAVTCESIQDCVGNAFGPGLTYDDAANAFTAHVSTVAGNAVSIAGDGGLYAATGTATTVGDTPTVNLTQTGGLITADVIVDPAAGNVLTSGAAGLLVSCEAVQDCVGNAFGPGLTYNDATNAFSAHVSTVAGNAVSIAGDGGLYTPTGSAVTVADTATVDLTQTGGGLITASVIVDPAAGNVLTSGAAGLLVSCEAVQDCVGNAFGPGLTYNDATNAFTAHVSTDAGNSVSLGGDGGLFVPPGGAATVTTASTPCITLTGDGSGATPLTPAPVINAAAGNLLSCTGTGLRAALTTTPSNCITFSGTGSVATPLSASPVIDPVATNTLSCTATGLRNTITSGPCGIQGAGTVASPLTAKVGTWAWPCADSFGTSVYCRASDGQLIADPPTLTFHDQAFTNSTFANLTVPAALTNIANATVNIANPSTCRTAMTMFELEADIDFTLPAGASAVSALNGDAITKIQNTGGSTMTQVHVQGSKTVPGGDTAPGGTAVGSTDGAISNGTGGATYSRAQITIRGWAWAINP